MSLIVEFLEARIAEDEQTALASASPEWEWLEGDLVSATGKWTKCNCYCVWKEPSAVHRGPQRTPGHEHYRVDDTVIESFGDYGYESEVEVSDADAAHIARHDPARVLREVAAKRAIIAEHLGTKGYVYTDDGTPACETCGDSTELWPCRTILALAAIYSDHPDHQTDWTP